MQTTTRVHDTDQKEGNVMNNNPKASLNRFSSVPYDSLAWLRADLTGEKASESDDAGWDHSSISGGTP